MPQPAKFRTFGGERLCEREERDREREREREREGGLLLDCPFRYLLVADWTAETARGLGAVRRLTRRGSAEPDEEEEEEEREGETERNRQRHREIER